MLNFKKPVIEDKEWVDECFKYAHTMNCEYTFGNVFIWSTSYRSEICHFEDFFISRWGKDKDIQYSLPIGNGNFKKAVYEIIADAKGNGVIPKIYGVTDSYKGMLDFYFPYEFSYEEDRGFSDYIYLTEKMANLSGKKYHGKRNHITNFKKNNPNWAFEKIDSTNISECIDLHSNWISDKDDDNTDYSFEFEAVLNAFENYDALNLVGGLIRVDEKPIAYTLGEARGEELFVSHIEKAPSDVNGAYAIINQEFTKNCLMNYKYVNREEDLGLEGLRKAKLSYHPEILLQKSIAVFEGKND